MNFQLIALDMDGTVLKNDKTVSKRTMEALGKAAALGIQIVPATGRVAKTVPEEMLRLPGVRYLLTSNGASVVDLTDRSVLYSHPMTMEASLRIVRFFVSRGYFMEAYCGGVSYANEGELPPLRKAGLPEEFFRYIDASQTFVSDLAGFLERNGIPLEKVNLPYVPALERGRLRREILAMGPYSVTSSGTINLEINDRSASKGDGLRHLCETLGIDRKRVAAFGDGDNDRSMLKFAGLGVAMGNAEPDLFRDADYVTGTNEEDGVASAVEKFILSEES
ncbi:5-amino-6-(5-phospho-D-ribitylamino)uracil phosphatase YcsE [Caprobacter fermentans]|uniref:5-amino-6-(5-phospho-D-ribitylamino)uracil phosphatase YcsE n=1 Tax=Caproicibacter fermentans TaxID=2576756 RepID=A0A6N8HY90_9FIRM|nr:Cof-type HAD-IIB family hydrolase [Caproicibacter fermentans]MVB10638.1 5-amino-6-(5-phospho-D-ribitylamino)uracil phosphatase YcsE [Caproicibacter fermentans]